MSVVTDRWIKGRCPACHGDGVLFVGNGGFITCSYLSCPDPSAATKVLSPSKQAMSDINRRIRLTQLIEAELGRAYSKHGRDPWGRHEFYAILLEEVEEMWDAIKADEPSERVLAELVQVASMCFRYWETGDRYRGEHPADDARPAVSEPK